MQRLSCWCADFLTLFRGIFSKIIHYYYPEDTAFFSPIFLGLMGRKIVYTVHLDDAVWRDGRGMGRTFFLKRFAFRFTTVVVCLSSSQAVSLQQAFPKKRVVFVPHGLPVSGNSEIEINRALVARRRQLRRIVVVGDNYRDLDMLLQIIQGMGDRSATFHLLGFSKKAKLKFLDLPGVVLVERLSPRDFDEYIVESFSLLLPLTFATANNALLEAHVAGVPAICSNIDGVVDYVTAHTKLFDDASQYWSEFDSLWRLSDDEYLIFCTKLRCEAISKFSWNSIRSELDFLYQ